jgi:hypothetical protein
MFPKQFACIGVEAHDSFLFFSAFAGDVLQVDTAIHYDRSRATAIWRFPREVLPGWGP